jgi:hypothetical protein
MLFGVAWLVGGALTDGLADAAQAARTMVWCLSVVFGVRAVGGTGI